MIRFQPIPRTAFGKIAPQWGFALALLGLTLSAPDAQAAPWYDDGAGNGCVSCHNGFSGGNGALHTTHRNQLGVQSCNLCHPSGPGSTPVLTYWSGPGGGYGCAGCHGQDYGETSPNSLQPKATSYGLRLLHENNGVTSCGLAGGAGCHVPGSNGHPDPFPVLFGENEAPLYYNPTYSSVLTDPCSSSEEDMTFDVGEFLGLDNDGDGDVDYPADSDCGPPATPTATPTPMPFDCGVTPIPGCVAPGKAVLLVSEKSAGQEKLKVVLKKLQTTTSQGDFGDPVTGSTAYKVCIYDAADQLSGEYNVDRSGDTCGDKPCWSTVSSKGYKYLDTSKAEDGILKIKGLSGDAGKGKVLVVGKNGTPPTMPTGVAAALLNQTSATVQVLTNDAACFGASLTDVKKADGTLFKAIGP